MENSPFAKEHDYHLFVDNVEDISPIPIRVCIYTHTADLAHVIYLAKKWTRSHLDNFFTGNIQYDGKTIALSIFINHCDNASLYVHMGTDTIVNGRKQNLIVLNGKEHNNNIPWNTIIYDKNNVNDQDFFFQRVISLAYQSETRVPDHLRSNRREETSCKCNIL